jgi:hypothetical protein
VAGGAYAVQQVGRTAFMVIALRGHPLEANFQRIQSRAGFADAVALWWLYFDQSAEAAAEETARSDDPGRLGRSAYHLIHPVMVAGIAVLALLGLAAKAIPGLGLAACAAGVGGGGAPPAPPDRLAPHGLRATPQ